MIRQIYVVALLLCLFSAKLISCRAEDITVHVVDSTMANPVPNIRVVAYRGCMDAKHPKAIQQKTGQDGVSVFHGLSLSSGPICIILISTEYQPLDLDAMFASPNDAKHLNPDHKLLNPIVTSLPAKVTFHVRRRTLGERLHFLFIGG